MKGKYRYGIVRIRVAVGVKKSGVVYRQSLNHPLASESCPVSKFLEVLEFADTETVVCSERENRYCYASAFPSGLRTTENTVVLHDGYTFLQTPYLTVFTPFDVSDFAGLEVIDYILVLYNLSFFYLYHGSPCREVCITHNEFVVYIPVSEFGNVAHNSDTLCRQYLWSINGEADVSVCFLFEFLRVQTVEKSLYECCGMESLLIVALLPEVAYCNFF